LISAGNRQPATLLQLYVWAVQKVSGKGNKKTRFKLSIIYYLLFIIVLAYTK
jgi:hypothetical protein